MGWAIKPIVYAKRKTQRMAFISMHARSSNKLEFLAMVEQQGTCALTACNTKQPLPAKTCQLSSKIYPGADLPQPSHVQLPLAAVAVTGQSLPHCLGCETCELHTPQLPASLCSAADNQPPLIEDEGEKGGCHSIHGHNLQPRRIAGIGCPELLGLSALTAAHTTLNLMKEALHTTTLNARGGSAIACRATASQLLIVCHTSIMRSYPLPLLQQGRSQRVQLPGLGHLQSIVQLTA
jgi:hypothetical protein